MTSLLDQVAEVAKAAGKLAFSHWRGDFQHWQKTPGEPVSEIDLRVNQMLYSALRDIDPDAGWFSEETADSAERLLCSRVWVVDPIDGTRDYIRGRNGWCVSIALVEGGRPVLGILDAPARSEHWTAAVGHPAHRNGERIYASSRAELPGSRVPADTLPTVDADLVAVEKPNSIALRMAMVAADEADLLAAVRWGHEWDIAAASLIAQQAGAAVTDALGRVLRFNSTRGRMFGVLAAAPGIHHAALVRLSDRADKGVHHR